MINKELVKYSLKNIAHRKSRSFLTIFSILVGISTIFIFVSFGQGLFDYVNELKSSSGADKVTVIPKGIGAPGLDKTFFLTEEDLKAVSKTSGVYEASGIYSTAAEISKSKTNKFIFLVGFDTDHTDLMKEVFSIDLDSGRDLRNGDDKKAILGYNYQIEDKILPGKLTLNDNLEVQGEKIRIAGFFEQIGNPQDDSNIYITQDYFEKLYPNSSGKYNQIVAKVDADNIQNVIDRIEDELRKSRGLKKGKEDFFVSSFEDLLEQFTSALNYIVYFVIFIALISVVVSAVNTANTTITSVIERVKEIGIMKAIGARNSEVFAIFVFEAGFLGFVAGVIGIMVGLVVTSIAGAFLKNAGWGFLSPHYSWQLFLGCILFATLTGALSGIIPSWRASKIRPVRALRYE